MRCCRSTSRSGWEKRWRRSWARTWQSPDEGAEALAACPDLKNLERLDLSKNALTAAGIQRLKATGVKLEAGEQHEVDDEEYLADGDWE